MTAVEYTGSCKHVRLQEESTTDTYDSEFGRDDELVETITSSCLDCGATYSEPEEVWYV